MAIIRTATGGLRVVVYDSRIDAMAQPGGMVFAYAKRKTDQTVVKAQDNAPVRSGRLKRGIRGDTRPLAKGMVVGRVRSTARYSAWVHEGTYGPITARSGDAMWVPGRKGGVRRVWMQEVAGQAAQPFLEDALRDSLRSPFGRRLLGSTNPFDSF